MIKETFVFIFIIAHLFALPFAVIASWFVDGKMGVRATLKGFCESTLPGIEKADEIHKNKEKQQKECR